MTRSLLAAVLAAGALMALPAAAQAASTTIVISELRTRGPSGGNDEFVELRNISNAPIDVGACDREVLAHGAVRDPEPVEVLGRHEED